MACSSDDEDAHEDNNDDHDDVVNSSHEEDNDDHEEEDGHLPNLHPLLVQHNCCHGLLGLCLIEKSSKTVNISTIIWITWEANV